MIMAKEQIAVARLREVAGQHQQARDNYLDAINIMKMSTYQLYLLSSNLKSIVEPQFQQFRYLIQEMIESRQTFLNTEEKLKDLQYENNRLTITRTCLKIDNKNLIDCEKCLRCGLFKPALFWKIFAIFLFYLIMICCIWEDYKYEKDWNALWAFTLNIGMMVAGMGVNFIGRTWKWHKHECD